MNEDMLKRENRGFFDKNILKWMRIIKGFWFLLFSPVLHKHKINFHMNHFPVQLFYIPVFIHQYKTSVAD